jgi:hypothetical protein
MSCLAILGDPGRAVGNQAVGFEPVRRLGVLAVNLGVGIADAIVQTVAEAVEMPASRSWRIGSSILSVPKAGKEAEVFGVREAVALDCRQNLYMAAAELVDGKRKPKAEVRWAGVRFTEMKRRAGR